VKEETKNNEVKENKKGKHMVGRKKKVKKILGRKHGT
jgi:hypothetical protein